jgi:hypothetical protein
MDAPERTLESRLKALGTLEGVTKDNPRIVLWRKLWAEVAALEERKLPPRLRKERTNAQLPDPLA